MRFVRITLVMIVAAVAVAPAQQRPELSAAVRAYIKVDAPVIALTHVRVIDGTGAAPREDQTVILRDGNIAEMGDFARVTLPEGATTIDLTGKSVIPGLVMVHTVSSPLPTS